MVYVYPYKIKLQKQKTKRRERILEHQRKCLNINACSVSFFIHVSKCIKNKSMLKKRQRKKKEKKKKKSSKEKAELLTMAKDKEYKELPPSGIKFAFWHSGCLLHTGFGQQLFCGKQPISTSGRLQLQWLERVGHSLLPGCSQRLLKSQAAVTVNIIIMSKKSRCLDH